MEMNLFSPAGDKVGTIPFPSVFGEKANLPLIHQVVVAQRLNRRQGTSKVKTRHEVSGSTRKIYRQKGTGRARHGDIKAPLFVGGGRAFGPHPRNYECRLPQQIRRGAVRSALVLKQKEGKLVVLEALSFKAPKTKEAAALFKKLGLGSGLVVLEGAAAGVEKSIRNLEKFKACRWEALNLLDVMKYEHLILTRAALEKVAERERYS